jgi:hypothetical protein
MPNVELSGHLDGFKVGDRATGLAVRERPMRYQLVGEVMAHQG